MQITMIKNKNRYSILLPEKIQGKYWLNSYENGRTYKIISIESLEDSWQLNCEKYSRILVKKNEEVSKVRFDPSKMYRVISLHDDEKCLLYAENFDENTTLFKKYKIRSNKGVSISIGRDDCDISYANDYISELHATLMYYDKKWTIVDSESTNGTFLNNRAVKNASLMPGDVIYIMGLLIIIGEDFIAINRNKDIEINKNIFEEIVLPGIMRNTELDFYEEDPNYFYRIPRFKKNVSTAKISVDAAPKSQAGNETPFALTLGPSVTMGMASVATGAYSVTNAISSGNIKSAIPSMIMSTSMLLGTMVWPFITKSYERRKNNKKEKFRQEKYTEYIENKKNEISELADAQKKILEENVIGVNECVSGVLKSDQSLWERNMSQDDFLKFRVGIGDIKVDAEFTFPDDKFTLDEDNLSDKTNELRDMPKEIENAPVTISLYDNVVTSIYGNREKLLSFAKGIIVQNAFFYGYDDVKTVLIFDKYENEELGYLKWLPHVWNDDKTLRYIINDSDDLREISSYFRVLIENRSNMDDNQREKSAPYYLIYVFSRDLFLRADFLRDILNSEKKLNISIITFFNDFSEVPKESTQVIALNHDRGKLFDKNDTTGSSTDFRCDIYYHDSLLDYCKKLANVNLDIGSDYALPPVITFLELFGVGMIDHLNVLERWKENDPTKSLKTEVGLDTYGDKFYIDLHEKYHGPHGLVAGMTGSGKSEFIMTFILSLAVNYHPHEVSFVLIDYKGGGMAKSFENLPHTAGIITNLDGSSIKRSLVSIESELTRRQAIFTEAAKKLGISNIDIYKYQKAYRQGQVEKPLSHVFIIADEFAELKSQQPEFMAQLISAARIGRSLGVHLILATQKPSGVVDDQIWSNSKFRVCLKVQDRADSMDMLKRPDAAALKETGRFYLQVGYNELFMLGQSAWAGAPYIPSENAEKDDDTEIVVVDVTGREIVRSKLDKNNRIVDTQHKQLDEITKYLYDISESEGVHAEYLSLPPLPELLFYSDITEKYPGESQQNYDLIALVGEIDDPARQRKLPLYVDFTGEGNTLLYGVAGSGKENFIMMMLYDIICRHLSEDFNSYILDLGSEILKVYEAAPHVGGVVVTGEDEKVENLFKMLKETFAERRKLFSEYGGSLQSYCKETGKAIPNQLIIINNFEAFTEMYDKFSEDLQLLTREGRRYGIYFLLACSGANAVRYKLLQNFKQQFVLQQNDVGDYSGILGNTGGVYPAECKGRGIVKYEETFEFQTALPSSEDKFKEEIIQLCEAISNMGMPKARKIPVLPERVDINFLADVNISYEHLPYGVYKDDLSIAYLDLAKQPFVCISASDTEHTEFFKKALISIVSNIGIETRIITDRNNSMSNDDCESFVVDIFKTVTGRHKEKKADNSIEFDNLVIFIDGLTNIYDKLSADGKDKLGVLLSQNISNYSTAIIIVDGINDLKKINSKGWYTKSFGNKGIWIGEGASQQYVFTANGYMHEEAMPANDFGYDFMGNKYRMIKLLNGDDLDG